MEDCKTHIEQVFFQNKTKKIFNHIYLGKTKSNVSNFHCLCIVYVFDECDMILGVQ